MMLKLKNSRTATGHYMVISENTPTGIAYRVRFPAFMHGVNKSVFFHSSNGGAQVALDSAVKYRNTAIKA